MSVLTQFLSVAATQPQYVAVKDTTRSLTYERLASEIKSVAGELRTLGVVVGDRVAIRLSTSVDALIAACGCMWLGAIFVPVSPTDPSARIAGILHDCGPSVVIARADDEELPEGPWIRVAYDDISCGNPVSLDRPVEEGPAYCIYTSGTTGAPKGVVIGHESFAHAVNSTITRLGMGTGTRSLCISAFHFDGSFASQFTTIASGGSLIIFRREPMVLPRAFVRTVRDEQVTVVFCSPSFLRLLLTSRSIEDLADSSLVQIVFGGEASTERHLRQLFAALPRAHFYNQYGPTETVISVSLHEITMEQLESGDLPIGLPHPGVTFTLFDEHDHEVDQTDEAGELYVGGAQLMEGYWADPELSARVLRRDLAPPKVLYRTGDLVRRNAEGDFVYIGRADRVIKRTGMRISLDEIERNLRQLPGVTNAGCIAVASEDATKIVAYVAIEEGVTTLGLFAGLAKWLPRSMIPDTMCLVDSMPLTAAGKVDYRALTVIYGG